MPRWTPEPLWKGSDAIIIGGGDSLRDNNFPWDTLKDEMTIGCNAAYKLGKEICSIVLWGDSNSFPTFKDELRDCDIPIFTQSPKLFNSKLPWLRTIRRMPHGLHHDAIGWNGNTGVGAINLAFLLGCPKVYLLGFDMSISNGRSNWHNDYKKLKKQPGRLTHGRFMRDIEKYVVPDWKAKFGDREIINVNDRSRLTCFPILSYSEFLAERSEKCALVS